MALKLSKALCKVVIKPINRVLLGDSSGTEQSFSGYELPQELPQGCVITDLFRNNVTGTGKRILWGLHPLLGV